MSGISAWCLDNIVRQEDLMSAHKRIKNDAGKEKTLEEQLQEMKNIAGGKLFKMGNICVGKTVFQVRKENSEKAEHERQENNTKRAT